MTRNIGTQEESLIQQKFKQGRTVTAKKFCERETGIYFIAFLYAPLLYR